MMMNLLERSLIVERVEEGNPRRFCRVRQLEDIVDL